MKVLHIIRREADPMVQEIIDQYRTKCDVSILLIQDGVLAKLENRGEIYASINDVRARGGDVSYKLVDYPAICEMVIGHDKVVVW